MSAKNYDCFSIAVVSVITLLIFGNCKKPDHPRPDTTQVITNPVGNKFPIANAGPEQVIYLPQDSVILDGTSSSDPDGVIVKFHWSQLSGSFFNFISQPDSSRAMVKNMKVGNYIFQLEVTDNKGATSKASVSIKVTTTANKPPVANPGFEQIIYLPQDSVILDGTSSSDPDGVIVKFKWTKLSGDFWFISKPDSARTVVKNLRLGNYIFQLEVTDNKGATSKASVSIKVLDNPAPLRTVKAKLLEYGTNLPLEGAKLWVCTSPIFPFSCGSNYISITSDINGLCNFQANRFQYSYVEKTGYFQNGPMQLCLVEYFRNDTLLAWNSNFDADSFVVKVIPKTNFTVRIRNTTYAGTEENVSMIGDVLFDCFNSSGVVGANLRPGIDTSFQVFNYWGNTNYLFRVGTNYDSDCDCFQNGLYTQVKYVAKGNATIVEINY